MTRLIPDTIKGRTMLVLFVGLVLSHAIGMFIYVSDRATALDLAGGEHIAERIVTLTQLIENAPLDERNELIRLANNQSLRVSWSEANVIHGPRQSSWQADVLRRSFASHLDRIGSRPFSLRHDDSPLLTSRDSRERVGHPSGAKGIRVSVRTINGGWLNFETVIDAPESIWSLRFVLSMAVMLAAVILLSIVVVHHMNRPMQVVAYAARRLGRDVAAPSIPVFGPREVREVIESFNEMQQRIRRLIEDRTHMLTAVSHDLRTPITLLRLRAEFVDDEEERSKILATLDDMETMISSVLAFAREDAETETPETVDLAALVESICDDLAEAGMPVEFAGPEKLPYECRRMAIRRTVTNLIDNAVKYGQRASVQLEATPEAVTIVVEDEGPGIPDEELERVFSPFYRLESSRGSDTGGTGLGLSVARAMVLANGGDLTLENRPDGGLRATVRLSR